MSEDNIMRKESEIENKITNKYLQLFNEKHLEDVIHFNKIAVLHIACEMMITVYLLEMFAFLTNWFIKDPITIPLLTIFLPPLVAIPLSLVFTGLSISFFRKRVNDYSSQYSSYEYLTQRDYVNIYKQFKKDTIKINF